MTQEIEIKLHIAAKSIPLLKRHPLLLKHLTVPAQRHKLTSIYYDAPDMTLFNAKLSLRVRRFAGNWYQSVKSAGTVQNGLHSRDEWEDCLKKGTLDFDKARSHGGLLANIFADDLFCQTLRPIFITEVWRTEWQLFKDQQHIEIALDIGKLTVPGTNIHAGISEVELELKSGQNVPALHALADVLQRDLTLTPENTSKADLGYQLYQNKSKP